MNGAFAALRNRHKPLVKTSDMKYCTSQGFLANIRQVPEYSPSLNM